MQAKLALAHGPTCTTGTRRGFDEMRVLVGTEYSEYRVAQYRSERTLYSVHSTRIRTPQSLGLSHTGVATLRRRHVKQYPYEYGVP